MSEIIAFIGSARKNGFSTKLAEQVIAGAKSVGTDVTVYNLNDEGIRGCQGCLYCRTHDGCAVNDKLQPMYAKFAECDGIVASFPIYSFGINGQGKQWIDRMYPIMGDDFKPRHPGKNLVTVFAQGNPDETLVKATIDIIHMLFGIYGMKLIDSLLIHGTGDPEYVIPPELLKRAFEAGRQLVK
jgi:multimeric flavodoxin WrbA